MKNNISTVCALAITTFLCQPTFAADWGEAVFGLRWGMTTAEVKAVGVSLTKQETDRNLDTYKATSLPKNVSDIEQYGLIFADGRLVKVWSLSKDIADDPSGAKGKERFEVLRATLSKKYGDPVVSYQHVGKKLYKEYDEFYQCLNYKGCGLWAMSFETESKSIVVELKGLKRGVGYIDVTAEAIPQWGQALEAYKSRQNQADRDAL